MKVVVHHDMRYYGETIRCLREYEDAWPFDALPSRGDTLAYTADDESLILEVENVGWHLGYEVVMIATAVNHIDTSRGATYQTANARAARRHLRILRAAGFDCGETRPFEVVAHAEF